MYTYDELAARYILSGNTRALEALARDAELAAGASCPDCGCREVEDNGHLEYRCTACDHRWGTEAGERYGF